MNNDRPRTAPFDDERMVRGAAMALQIVLGGLWILLGLWSATSMKVNGTNDAARYAEVVLLAPVAGTALCLLRHAFSGPARVLLTALTLLTVVAWFWAGNA